MSEKCKTLLQTLFLFFYSFISIQHLKDSRSYIVIKAYMYCYNTGIYRTVRKKKKKKRKSIKKVGIMVFINLINSKYSSQLSLTLV